MSPSSDLIGGPLLTCKCAYPDQVQMWSPLLLRYEYFVSYIWISDRHRCAVFVAQTALPTGTCPLIRAAAAAKGQCHDSQTDVIPSLLTDVTPLSQLRCSRIHALCTLPPGRAACARGEPPPCSRARLTLRRLASRRSPLRAWQLVLSSASSSLDSHHMFMNSRTCLFLSLKEIDGRT